MNQEEREKQYGQLIAKAWTDDEFKARLKADPRATLAEVGIEPPAGLEIEVLESTPGKAYLVIPPKPVDELSDADLEKVAGGAESGFGDLSLTQSGWRHGSDLPSVWVWDQGASASVWVWGSQDPKAARK